MYPTLNLTSSSVCCCQLTKLAYIFLSTWCMSLGYSEKKQWCWRINMQICFSCVRDWQKLTFWTFQKWSGHWAKIVYFCTNLEKWSLTKAKIWLDAEMSFASHNLGKKHALFGHLNVAFNKQQKVGGLALFYLFLKPQAPNDNHLHVSNWGKFSHSFCCQTKYWRRTIWHSYICTS